MWIKRRDLRTLNYNVYSMRIQLTFFKIISIILLLALVYLLLFKKCW